MPQRATNRKLQSFSGQKSQPFPALHKSRAACEAGVSKAREAGDSIKPGAQAPGSDHKRTTGARETGDSVKFTGFRPLSRAPTSLLVLEPGACAPGFMLTPAIAG